MFVLCFVYILNILVKIKTGRWHPKQNPCWIGMPPTAFNSTQCSNQQKGYIFIGMGRDIPYAGPRAKNTPVLGVGSGSSYVTSI